MYQIKLHNPKTIAKRFLALSNLNHWKRGELSVERHENYILVVGEKLIRKSEEVDEQRKVFVHLSDDFVEVLEGSVFISYSSCKLVGRQDHYVLENDYALRKDHRELKGSLSYWPIIYFDLRSELIYNRSISERKPETTVFQDTNRAPIVPLTKVKRK